MRSLFLKIFLWFWLTVIVVGVALAISVIRVENRLNPRFHQTETVGPVLVPLPRTVKVTVLVLPVITSVVGGLFCLLITRHITSPMLRLRAAAASIARGNLETRVSPALGERRDEIAALAQDFDRMAERIESLVGGHKRLLGDVSHELRSPLSRLVVALGLARKASTAEASEHLERIATEANRLDKLIGQLLMLSRMGTGMHAAAGIPFELANLVLEVASDADFEARAHTRKVVVTAADACSVIGAEELLRSAIENVVRNAIRFTAEDTSVEISLRRQGGLAVIRVRDHGPGVAEDMLAEIFLPFRRVRTAGEPATEGAGLGLTIAQRAIAMHAGTIRAVNAADGGLIVEIQIPLVREANPG
jgi:two-component system sensor histidine kinase CpxA